MPNLVHFRDSFAFMDFAWVLLSLSSAKKANQNEGRERERTKMVVCAVNCLTKDFMLYVT